MELMIPLDSSDRLPMYEQIYEYVKREIRRGNLTAGMRLPSTRALAENLRISRSTTQLAYEQLAAEGYLETVPCRGYFVMKEIPADLGVTEPAGTEKNDGAAPKGSAEEASKEAAKGMPKGAPEEAARGERPRPAGETDFIDFSPRGIDLDHFPYNAWRRVTKATLMDGDKEMFLPGEPQGEAVLRRAIRSYLHSARGVECGEDQIIIGAGSEYLLMLLSLILGRDRKVAMESPTYRQAYRVFRSLGHPVAPVAMDRHGMSVKLLEESGAGIAYIMPSHQYPLGIVMPVSRRQELLCWAAAGEHRYLIEDDYDSEFRYKGKPIPAMQGMDRDGRVIYMGTFSKSIAPAIRVGFLVLPERLLAVYRERLQFYATTVSRIDQHILCRFLTEGHYERHLNRMRAIYRGKHDLLLNALKRLEPDFGIQGEYAGLHVLLTDRGGRPESWLVDEARAKNVAVYGLSACVIDGSEGRYPSTVMLGYANVSSEQIVSGVERLCEAWNCEK